MKDGSERNNALCNEILFGYFSKYNDLLRKCLYLCATITILGYSKGSKMAWVKPGNNRESL
jgi:hypothetical protein